MLNSFSNKAIMTKAKAMYEQRLTIENYRDMIHKQSVSDIAVYLKSNTHFAEALDGIQESIIHRGHLENLLRKELFLRFISLSRYDSNVHDSFYEHMTITAEIQLILLCIRYIDSSNNVDLITFLPSYLAEHIHFSVKALADVKNFEELLSVLNKTPYHDILVHLRPVSGDPNIHYPACEHALNRYLYDQVFNGFDRFSSVISKNLHEIFGVQVGLINIANIYRMKRFYGLSPESIREFVYPHYGRMDKKQIDALIDAPDMVAFAHILENCPYKKYFIDADLDYIEGITRHIKCDVSRHFMHFASDAPTVFTAYLALVEVEVENLINIIEGVRYAIPPEEIEKRLVL